ncbi:hypothetical protein [Syntrophomonas wolfei]|nr:hypothetical protein [Syntrophomonas wolfei]
MKIIVTKSLDNMTNDYETASDCSLEELVEKKSEVQRLKKMRERKRRELFEEEDKIERENERLQEEMRRRMRGRTRVARTTIAFIHDVNPVFDRKRLLYIYPNGIFVV